jgi:hypothetical protein
MPSYDFQCEAGHYTEKFTRIADMPDSVICWHDVNGSPCNLIAPRVFISPATARDAQPIDPIIVYRKDDGGFIYPGDSSPRSYEGCERVELRTLGEVRRVTAEQDRLDYEHWERGRIADEQINGPMRRERRSALMNRLSTQFGKDFARVAIERIDAKRAGKRYTPGNHYEVAEMDRSNREPSRNEQSGWKARHG